MSKIDFIKVEETLANALSAMFVKKIKEGKPAVSKRAVRFYRLDDGPRPKMQDPVIQTLEELREEEKKMLEEEKSQEEEEALSKKETPLPPSTPPQIPAEENVPTDDDYIDPEKIDRRLFMLALLRQNLKWFRKHRIKNLDARIGSNIEEVRTLEDKETLTPEELHRLGEIVKKSHEVRVDIMKELGLDTDEVVIEKQREKHSTRRFNVKDHWLPLS